MLCSELDGSCDCDGVLRFADSTANANSVHHDGITFKGVEPESTSPAGFSGDWLIASSSNFQGHLAHYYKTSGSTECSAAALIPSTFQDEYTNFVSRAGNNPLGRDVSTWNCYCKASTLIVEQAKLELLGIMADTTKVVNPNTPSLREELLSADWSTYVSAFSFWPTPPTYPPARAGTRPSIPRPTTAKFSRR